MKKNIKLICVFAAVVFLCGAGIFAFWGGKNSASAQNSTLYWGRTGDDVIKAQLKLKQWGYYDGIVDGVYGADTSGAVKSFQRNNGLAPDGVVGPSTWAALGYNVETPAPSTAQASTTSRATSSDRNGAYLLASVIAGEARGEPYMGKVAVGAVIMNRVQSSAFPNTMAGVIYQGLAFESVANGQYSRGVDSESLKAARQVLSGWDPTNGALYFWNPSKPVNPWIWSRNITMRIGRHVFGI